MSTFDICFETVQTCLVTAQFPTYFTNLLQQNISNEEYTDISSKFKQIQ